MDLDTARRAFLRRTAVLSAAGAAAPWALQLAALGDAAAATATDYKALVCVFLFGGNDQSNTLPPYDAANHAAYAVQRPAIATAREALAATVLAPTTPLAGGRQYALAPQLAPLLPVFDAGRMAVLLNVGTLIGPTTKAQYLAKSVPLPPKLFSHNDQQSVWQSSSPEGSTSGWGGRLGDLFVSSNGNATFSCVSVSGNAVYLAGRSAVQYQVSASGSVPIAAVTSPLFGSAACSAAVQGLITADRANLLESEHARVTRRAIDADAQLGAALASAPTLATPFPAGNRLGDQLRMVARMISAREALGAKRQVFFVSIGGFDNHDNLVAEHAPLLSAVGGALAAFDAAMIELGVADRVTAFTASDFGRTLTSNGGGADHGWGSHHLLVGGAVRGRAFYGVPPEIANNGADDVGQGRLLPSTSVDQLGATLGRWFGVSDAEMPGVLPNIVNYATRDLGFLA
jgi:uncharacterized protein (DUF1501 family)